MLAYLNKFRKTTKWFILLRFFQSNIYVFLICLEFLHNVSTFSSCCVAFFVFFLFALFFFFWKFSTQDFFRFDPPFGFSFFLRPATFANCLGKLNGAWTLEFSTSILGVSLIFRYTCLLTLWSASSTCKQQSSKSAAREANEKNIRQRFLYLSVASNLGFSTISLPCISWIVSDLAPQSIASKCIFQAIT